MCVCKQHNTKDSCHVILASMASAGANTFLAENNPCGWTLLRLVARGNSIIAELLRLADNIPLPFQPGQTDPTHAKYGVLLFDFKCAAPPAAMAAAAQRAGT